VTSCEWFVLDNLEQHNAVVYGKLIDAGTGENVPSEIGTNLGYIRVVELGWKDPQGAPVEAFQTWNVKNNGNYRNNLVWAGKYRMDTKDANYYPLTTEFELKKGDNVVDFTVKPYVRFGQPTFTYDAASKKIIATCEVQVTDPAQTPTLNEVRLCCYTDCFVGASFNNCKSDAGAVASNVQFDANGKATVTVAIDTQDPANNIEFKYERVHYVRLAALATGAGVNSSSRYNYTQTYSIALDGSAAVEYTKW
jgi:hypothetical protein